MTQTPHRPLCIGNFLIIAALPTLFFLLTIVGYLGMIPFKIERHTLIIIGMIYLIFLFFVKHNANYAICRIFAEADRMKIDLQDAIRQNFLTIGEHKKSTLSIPEFVENYYRDVRNDNFASVAATVFPMLGILGTFVAIAISMPDFSVQETEALDREISLLLSGIGTAFYASIFGIFLSLLWIYFEKRGMSKFEHLIQDLRQRYHKFIWSESELRKHELALIDMKQQNMIRTLRETFNPDFIEKLNRHHLTQYKELFQTADQNLTHVAEQLMRSNQALQQTLEKIDTGHNALEATRKIDEQMERFIDVTRRLDRSIERFDTTLDNTLNLTFKKIDNEIGDIVIKLADFATLLTEQNRELHKQIETLRE